jgi:putative hydrolase of HD superfamily
LDGFDRCACIASGGLQQLPEGGNDMKSDALGVRLTPAHHGTHHLSVEHDEGSLVKKASCEAELRCLPTVSEAARDVDALVASLGLQTIRRYMDQTHWLEESRLAKAADDAEPGLKLENVAAHSWHVADATMLLAPHFPDVNAHRALELAIVHDKLELITGDFDPVGADGQGASSHAFNPIAQAHKTQIEVRALDRYLASLREHAREHQRQLLLEAIEGDSPEARLVKAVDKLQALTFVLAKKHGAMTDDHLTFSLRYSGKAVHYFPRLAVHHGLLVQRLLRTVASHRGVSVDQVKKQLAPSALVFTTLADE